MAYYIRHFGTRDGKVTEKDLFKAIQASGLQGSVQVDSSEQKQWTSLTVFLGKNKPVAYIERCPVLPGTIGANAVQEFMEDAEDLRPESGGAWVADYLGKVKVVYAVQLLYGIEHDEAWPLLDVVQGKISEAVGGIVQADAEGFMNEMGEFITCDFPDGVDGLVRAAVRDAAGDWYAFDLDLADTAQRKAFADGSLEKEVIEATTLPGRPQGQRAGADG